MGTVRRIFAHLYSCARRDVLVDHDLHRNATIAYLRVAVWQAASPAGPSFRMRLDCRDKSGNDVNLCGWPKAPWRRRHCAIECLQKMRGYTVTNGGIADAPRYEHAISEQVT